MKSALFEIRLDNEIIVLHGSQETAACEILRGTVVLSLPAPLSITGVYLQMTGSCRIGLTDSVAGSWSFQQLFDRSWEIFRYKWPSLVDKGSKNVLLQAGRSEWPFELEIPGSLQESVDGLYNSHVSYRLRAMVTKGILGPVLQADRTVRVVRALLPSSLSSSGPLREEKVWPEIIKCQFYIPQRAIAFGTALPIHLHFTPLSNGLRIARVKFVLVESQEFRMPGTTPGTSFKRRRIVEQHRLELGRQDVYILQDMLQLPQRFDLCAPDTDLHAITVRHEMQVTLELHNPDGEILELRKGFPVIVFISPNMSFDNNGCINHFPRDVSLEGDESGSPPTYDNHILDPILDLATIVFGAGGDEAGVIAGSGNVLQVLRSSDTCNPPIYTSGVLDSPPPSLSL